MGSRDRDGGGGGRRLRRDAPGCRSSRRRPTGTDAVKQEIRIVSDGDDRETFTPAGKTSPQLEDLQISNFTTAGKFESSYAAIFGDRHAAPTPT